MADTGRTGSALHRYSLDFEKPILELEDKIEELKQLAAVQNVTVDDEVQRLTDKAERLRAETFSKLRKKCFPKKGR